MGFGIFFSFDHPKTNGTKKRKNHNHSYHIVSTVTEKETLLEPVANKKTIKSIMDSPRTSTNLRMMRHEQLNVKGDTDVSTFEYNFDQQPQQINNTQGTAPNVNYN